MRQRRSDGAVADILAAKKYVITGSVDETIFVWERKPTKDYAEDNVEEYLEDNYWGENDNQSKKRKQRKQKQQKKPAFESVSVNSHSILFIYSFYLFFLFCFIFL